MPDAQQIRNNAELQAHILKMLETEANLEKQAILSHKMHQRSFLRRGNREREDAETNAAVSKLKDVTATFQQEATRGYNQDWISSMYAIMALCDQMEKVLTAWNLSGRAIAALDEFLGKMLSNAGEENQDAALPLSHLIASGFDQYFYENPPMEAVPRLRFYAEIGQDGKLTFDSLSTLRRSDGKLMFPNGNDPAQDPEGHAFLTKLRQSLEIKLQAGLTVWLRQHGYQPEMVRVNGQDQPTGAYVDMHDPTQKLTQTVFEELQEDGSLEAFLKGEFPDVEFQQEPASLRM